MKILLLIILSFVSIRVISQDLYKKGELFYVWANSGLNLREDAERDSKILVTIPFGEKVILDSIIEMSDFEEELFSSVKINDKWTPGYSVKGRMIKVSYRNYSGYIFSGFLSRVKPIYEETILFDLDKIFEKEFGIDKQFDFGDSVNTNIEILYKNGYLHFRRAYVYWFEEVYIMPNISFDEGLLDISVILTPLIGLIQRTDVKLTILPISIFS